MISDQTIETGLWEPGCREEVPSVSEPSQFHLQDWSRVHLLFTPAQPLPQPHAHCAPPSAQPQESFELKSHCTPPFLHTIQCLYPED